MLWHLMGMAEIALRLGVGRQRTYQLTQRPDWPSPCAELQQSTSKS
jgi:prophage regulatory protein